MEELEQSFTKGRQIENDIVYSNYGILGDSVGAGKSLMILAHIARVEAGLTRPIGSHQVVGPASSTHFFSTRTKTHTDISEAGSLIIVPHTLFRQWAEYIKKQTTFKALCLSRASEVTADRFLGSVLKAPVVLVSNTLLKTFIPAVNGQGLRWKRIFFDEADTIHMPGFGVNSLPAARFYWYVTASWVNLLFMNQHIYMDKPSIHTHVINNPEYAHMKQHFLTLLNTQNYYIYLTHVVKSWSLYREVLSPMHPYRSHAVIKCSDLFIQQSISLPPLYKSVIWCKAPLSHRVVQGVVSGQIQQMLNAGDVTSALDVLGVKGQDSKSLVDAVTANLRKELKRLEQTYAFKEGLEYSTPQAKEIALKSLTEKIQRTKDAIQGMQDRITSLETEMCPICYEDPVEPLVTPCCSRIFCAACLLMSMSRNPVCPMCRGAIAANQCTKLLVKQDGGANAIVEKGADPMEEELLKKPEALLKFLQETPNGRFLIFSKYDSPFEKIEVAVEELGIVAKQLKGNKDAIAATLLAFDRGDIRCLLLNARYAGAGLNIIGATHVVLFHSMTHEEEKQILGRAYRMGRVGPLHFVKLLNKGEESYSEGADVGAEVNA
jgi:hypothetical protein